MSNPNPKSSRFPKFRNYHSAPFFIVITPPSRHTRKKMAVSPLYRS
ncbi:hypothetical protein COLO4_10719 [Corchorus olitorius]|uniref:Uncharacterized protein n=1 Tax=Corchorus olitorius TaxID=93759 RepID=A0A1R3K767_9ROSI|nr:hypothetical protein COLO4_10719 [Corchorus olitorius]